MNIDGQPSSITYNRDFPSSLIKNLPKPTPIIQQNISAKGNISRKITRKEEGYLAEAYRRRRMAPPWWCRPPAPGSRSTWLFATAPRFCSCCSSDAVPPLRRCLFGHDAALGRLKEEGTKNKNQSQGWIWWHWDWYYSDLLKAHRWPWLGSLKNISAASAADSSFQHRKKNTSYCRFPISFSETFLLPIFQFSSSCLNFLILSQCPKVSGATLSLFSTSLPLIWFPTETNSSLILNSDALPRMQHGAFSWRFWESWAGLQLDVFIVGTMLPPNLCRNPVYCRVFLLPPPQSRVSG